VSVLASLLANNGYWCRGTMGEGDNVSILESPSLESGGSPFRAPYDTRGSRETPKPLHRTAAASLAAAGERSRWAWGYAQECG